jgi:hypothetical protein
MFSRVVIFSADQAIELSHDPPEILGVRLYRDQSLAVEDRNLRRHGLEGDESPGVTHCEGDRRC